jgi:protein SCO1/2
MRFEQSIIHRGGQAICLVGFLWGFTPPTQAHDHMQGMVMGQTVPGQSVYNLESEWTNQNSATMKLTAFRGRPVVAAMVYTHCKDICPVVTEKMLEIGDKLPRQSRDQVQFVLFSMDWVRDTPAQLTSFAALHHLDLKHWTLLHGDENAVRELAAVLGVSFHRDEHGDFQHSIAIFLLDADGVIAAQENSLQAPAAGMVRSIRQVLATRVHN